MNIRTIQLTTRALTLLGALFAWLGMPVVAQASDCAAAPMSVEQHLANRGANHCPRAHAGMDMPAMPGQPAILDATASSDADGQRLSFAWRIVSAPADSVAAIEDAAALRTAFTPDLFGDYVFEVAVTDASGATSVDTVRYSATNSAPLANAGADVTAPLGAYVDLDALRSFDIDGSALSYSWQLIAQPAGSLTGIDGDKQRTASLFLDAAGDYVAELVVSDGRHQSVADTVRISTHNSAPRADAGRARTLSPDSTLILNAADSVDVDGDALAYHWALVSAPAGSSIDLAGANPLNPSLRVMEEGLYLFQLIVDDGVYFSEPDTVVVEVVTRRMDNVDPKDFAHLTNRGGGDDTDGDGILDPDDNCVLVANAPQRDTDGDGLGNFCDADLNNDGVTNVIDLGILRTVFFTNDPDADFNGNGVVNAADLGIMKSRFFLPPGPAGTIIWVSLVDGDFANRLNWEPQTVPSAGTLALIDVAPAVTVTATSDNITVKDLVNNETLALVSTTFEATGALENGGSVDANTTTINNTQIIPSLAGSGTVTLNASSHTWSNVVLGVDTTFNNGAIVNQSNGLGVNATVTITAPSLTTGFQFSNSQSMSGTGTIVFDAAGNTALSEPRLFPASATTLTIDAGLTIRGGNGTVGQAFGNLVMNASVNSDVSGGTLVVAYATGSGQGSLTASGGGTLDLTGNFDNAGNAISIDGATGTVNLRNGAALRNGTVNATAGTDIIVGNGSTTMQNLVFNGDMTHVNGAITNVSDGLTLNGNALIEAPSLITGFQFGNTQTLSGSGTITIDGSGNSNLSEARLFPASSTTLTIGPNIVVRGGNGTIGQAFGDLVFQGQLIAEVDQETLRLGGATWTANDSITAVNGGQLDLFGNFDNASNALAIDAADGQVGLTAGAALRNATINGTVGTTLRFPAGSTTLQAMTLNLDTDHVNSASTSVTDGLTLNGNALITAPNLTTGFTFTNTQTLDGTGTITFAGSNSNVAEPRLFPASSTTLTIGPNITVRGGNARIGQAFANLVFNGTLISDVAAERLEIGGAQWSASQTLQAINGAQLHLYGTHDNDNASFILDTAAGTTRLVAGAVLRETVVNGTAGTNVIFSAGSTTLDTVTMTADTTHENNANTSVSNGLTLNGTATIISTSLTTGFVFTNSQSLLGNLIIVFDSASNSNIAEPRLFPASSTTLTIGPNVAIQGANGTVGQAFANMVFSGSLDASVSGATLRVAGSTWSGTGSLSASNGGTLLLSGIFDNGGQTLSIDTAGGSASMLSGTTLRNGTISAAAGSDINAPSGSFTFDNLVYDGDLNLDNGASISVSNGFTFDGTAVINSTSQTTGFTFTNTQTLAGTGTFTFTNLGNNNIAEPRLFPASSTTLTIGAGITVNGGIARIGQAFATLVLEGTISADAGNMEVIGNAVVNSGLLEALNDSVMVLDNLSVPLNETNTMHMGPGSTIALSDPLTMNANSVMTIDADGPLQTDAGGFGGAAGQIDYAGTLNLNMVNGFTPSVGDFWVLTNHAGFTGSFATVNTSGLGGGQSIGLTFGPTTLSATVN